MVDIEKLWGKLQAATECTSHLKKVLTYQHIENLRDVKTKYGGTLEQCIRSGCLNSHGGCGIFASDPDAYNAYREVIDRIIKSYHQVEEISHPAPNFGTPEDIDTLDLSELDPDGKFIISTRVRVARSHKGYGFPPVYSKEERLVMESKTRTALENLTGDLNGTYHPLSSMTESEEKALVDGHYLFRNNDRTLEDAGVYRDWPEGTGIFYNENKSFIVWVNEEDHLRLISLQKGSNLTQVWKRLVLAITQMEKELTFEHDDKLGYLAFCPTNIGTTLRASVLINIPKLSSKPDFKAFCEKCELQVRGTYGAYTESVGGVCDLSNKRRLGITEIEALNTLVKGVGEVIKEEKRLQAEDMKK